MTTRSQIYWDVKSLRQRNNIPSRMSWPRGTTAQWQSELERLQRIVRSKREIKVAVALSAEHRETKNMERRLRKWVSNPNRDNIEITLTPKFISKIQLLTLIRRMTQGVNTVLKIDERNYALNANTFERIRSVMLGVQPVNVEGSDNEFKNELNLSPTLIVKSIPTFRTERKTGAFFPMLSSHDFDLSRQQVFRDEKEIEEGIKDNCLIHSLKKSGLAKKIINKIKQACLTRSIPQNKFKKICITNKIRISVKYANGKVKYYGDKKHTAIKIGLLKGHYFLIEKIPITKHAFANNLTLKDHNIIDVKGTRKNNRKIDTFQAITMIIENDNFNRPFNISKEILSTPFNGKIKDFGTLYEPTKDEVRKVENKESVIKPRQVLHMDFETTTDEKLHKPFLCHYYDQANPDKIYEYIGEDCALKMLRSLRKDTLFYAHNAGYDYRFLLKYLIIKGFLNPQNNFMNCKGIFYNKDLKKNIEIEVRDSYKLISKPLRDFGKCFKLEQAKEIMPYSLQTKENINKCYISINECQEAQELKKPEDYKLFMDNCYKWDCVVDDNINIVKYASIYCRIDCVVLAKGMEIFRGWMLEATKLDIYNILTIPSLAHKYIVGQGCYEGVCEISSVARSFIQKCLVGGRVMLANNMKIIREGKIADFDGVSLYPSAMDRLGQIGGFLKGVPKVWNNKINLDNTDGYFIKIKITEVGQHRIFPLASIVANGVRTFTNDMVGEEIFIDKIALEDLVKFQKVKYEIIKGYYFNEGRNPKIKEVINYLFTERLKKKQQKNPIQEVYKLIMNAVYGKTLLKPVDKEDVIINDEVKMKKYINFNFSMVESFSKIHDSNKYIIKKLKSIDDHFNICHVGIEILSMSKRIMNEVMCLAEDKKIEIFYQDTDSMHMFENDIKELSETYKNEYKRDLVGKSLGQFHDDFSLKGCDKPYSSMFIGLGKKCYLDKLNGTTKDNKKISGFHLRCKGVPNSTLNYEAETQFNGDVVKMYEQLYAGEAINFDLLQGGNRVRFKKYNNLSIGSIQEFKRKLKF